MLNLKLAYTMRDLAREVNTEWDHRKLRRTLKAGGVVPRSDGKIWISDIKDHMPQFFSSWVELLHQRELAKIRLRSLEED